MNARLAGAAAALVFLAVLTACTPRTDEGSNEGPSSTPTSTTTADPDATSAPTPTPGPYALAQPPD